VRVGTLKDLQLFTLESMRKTDIELKTRSYFRAEFLYIYSLVIAGFDSLLFSSSDPKPFSFETYCMRALVIFSFWLIVKTLTDKVAKKGYSYRNSAIMISIGVIMILFTFAYLIAFI
jgi:hypothetical protein